MILDNTHSKLILSLKNAKSFSPTIKSGFIFKQWKKRFLLLTAEGSLLVCHDVSSPPDQLVQLQGGCDAIVEGKEILDLPKLPSGGCRDCCFALILPQNKYLLLLAETPADCRSGAFCTLSEKKVLLKVNTLHL
uniref:PH domain-containing protein n=1 Tax=Acanthochromis polyacanthus TaxID=80966 RepID=A0A3Q1EMQ3_9TELE